MSDVVLVPDHYYNCPICGQACLEEKIDGWRTVLKTQGACQQFICINPLANNPLHYYDHLVDEATPNRIAYQEFSIDIGSKYIMFALDLVHQKTLIKNSVNADALELDFIIVPDFPTLGSLKKKIRTAITFS